MVRDVYPHIQIQKHHKYSPGISKQCVCYAIKFSISYSWPQKKKKKQKKLENKKIRSQIKTTVKSKNSKRKLAKRK